MQHAARSAGAAVASRRNGMEQLRTPHGVCGVGVFLADDAVETHSIVILDIAQHAGEARKRERPKDSGRREVGNATRFSDAVTEERMQKRKQIEKRGVQECDALVVVHRRVELSHAGVLGPCRPAGLAGLCGVRSRGLPSASVSRRSSLVRSPASTPPPRYMRYCNRGTLGAPQSVSSSPY